MTVAFVDQLTEAEREAWLNELRLRLPEESIDVRSSGGDPADVDIAVVATPPVGVFSTFPNLRFVQSAWAGVDALLADASLAPTITLARLVDPAMGQAMIESVLVHVLGLHRQIPTYAAQQRSRTWRPLPQPLAQHRNVGVLGLGALGRMCANHLAAIGFNVRGWSRSATHIDGVETSFGPEGFRALLGASDIVVNLLPLTPETTSILDRAAFDALRPGASLVNVGRGAHVVDADLLAALDSGAIAHAILDVFHVEPLPDDHPYWTHPKVTVMPHVAADTNLKTAAAIVSENIRRYRRGEPVSGHVDRQRGY